VLPTYVAETLLLFDRVAINAGQRGVILEVAPDDLLRTLGASAIDLAAG
jgi:Cys-tRNA(Pro)/Cys-tRNA(Cys) deacylase